MRAAWISLLLPVACGPSFEVDGADTSGSGSTTQASAASSVASSSSAATSATTASSQVSASASTGIADPCLSGDYSGCVALDAPTLYFSFSEGSGDLIDSTLPIDDDVKLERVGVGAVAGGTLVGPALDMTTAGYEIVGADVMGMYQQLFQGDHPHTVEMWIAEPRVELGFSQTLFLQFGDIAYGDPPDYAASSAFMTMNNGVPRLTVQRRVFDQLDDQLLITATTPIAEADLAPPAHVFIVYRGQGELMLCRNAACTTASGSPGSGLDHGHWYLGYVRDTQSFSGVMDEVAFYEGPLDEAVMRRHCEAGFAAMRAPSRCAP